MPANQSDRPKNKDKKQKFSRSPKTKVVECPITSSIEQLVTLDSCYRCEFNPKSKDPTYIDESESPDEYSKEGYITCLFPKNIRIIGVTGDEDSFNRD